MKPRYDIIIGFGTLAAAIVSAMAAWQSRPAVEWRLRQKSDDMGKRIGRRVGRGRMRDVGAAEPQATGMLVKAVRAGAFERPQWVKVPMGDLTLTVARDALRADSGAGLARLPVSWPDTIEIANQEGWIAPSKKIADAIYASAPIKTAFHSLVTVSDPESGGAKMHGLPFAWKYNRDIDGQIAKAIASGKGNADGLVSGHEKYWILHPRLKETVASTRRPAAINYGGWTANGIAQQPPGGRHDIDYPGDYSQLYRPVQRYAERADGSKVDLLDWIEENEGVPRTFTNLFRYGKQPNA